MKKTNTLVTIKTATVGCCFATVAVVRSCKTGRRLGASPELPYGFDGAAVLAAERLCAQKGWEVAP